MAYVYASESKGSRVYIATCPSCKRDLSQSQNSKAMERLATGHDRCNHGD
jgi:transcription initiation factor IIE alpha subunit